MMSSWVRVRVSRSMSSPSREFELVAAHAREVVALGVEEQLIQQRPRGVDRGRLARALLLEQLDQRALLAADHLRVRVEGQADVQRVVEETQDLLVGCVAHRAQQHRHGQLALAVDADVDAALLVDLELEPRPARRHQVRDEHLLLAILRLHHVGAGGTHQLRHHDALGAVDDERAALGHPWEIAHEHGLLADLSGLPVDERDGDGQRPGVGQILLAALLEVGDRLVEGEVAELDGEVAGVVLDRRDVVDRLAQTAAIGVGQPREGLALDIDEVGDFKDLVQTREAPARPGGMSGCQDGDSSETVEREVISASREPRTPDDPMSTTPHEARPPKIAQGNDALWRDAQLSRTPPSDRRVCGAAPLRFGRLRLLADRGSVGAAGVSGKPGVRADSRRIRGTRPQLRRSTGSWSWRLWRRRAPPRTAPRRRRPRFYPAPPNLAIGAGDLTPARWPSLGRQTSRSAPVDYPRLAKPRQRRRRSRPPAAARGGASPSISPETPAPRSTNCT